MSASQMLLISVDKEGDMRMFGSYTKPLRYVSKDQLLDGCDHRPLVAYGTDERSSEQVARVAEAMMNRVLDSMVKVEEAENE